MLGYHQKRRWMKVRRKKLIACAAVLPMNAIKLNLCRRLPRRRCFDLGVVGPALQHFEHAVLNQCGHFLRPRDFKQLGCCRPSVN
jgi:hypothetical protein